ncbi:MAG: hypothetical protein N2449_02675 [Bacteroidales bacterium]|nr:hypothetical protein [Bacteroidales bacterium]
MIIKKIIYFCFGLFNYRGKKHAKKWEHLNSPFEKNFKSSSLKIGIVKEPWNMHYHYILACNELNISYRLIDIFSENWLSSFFDDSIQYFIFRPSVQYSVWKDMYDNRIRILAEFIPQKLFPNPHLLWLWESKLRQYEWLKAHQYPHAETNIFYKKRDALTFAKICSLPIVYKANMASGASGVKIIKSRFSLFLRIYRSFHLGNRTYRKHKLDKEHGYIILQQYLSSITEWRIFRMGKYYFGFQKIKKGTFHSGSHEFSYGMPPIQLLNFTKELTDKHNFKHVSIDYFIDEKHRFYINEIQVYFGQYQDRELLRIDNKSGRLFYDENLKNWVFEEGSFCKNNMANIRLLTLIDEHVGH